MQRESNPLGMHLRFQRILFPLKKGTRSARRVRSHIRASAGSSNGNGEGSRGYSARWPVGPVTMTGPSGSLDLCCGEHSCHIACFVAPQKKTNFSWKVFTQSKDTRSKKRVFVGLRALLVPSFDIPTHLLKQLLFHHSKQ